MADHDRLFKEIIRSFFLEFIEAFVPTLDFVIDRTTITFIDTQVQTEQKRHELDLVIKARNKETDCPFLVHIEVQSYQQKHFAERVFDYASVLWRREKLPVFSIALLTFTSPKKPQANCFAIQIPPGNKRLRFIFDIVQLNRLDWKTYRTSQNPVVTAFMAKMNIAASERPHVQLECVRLLVKLELNSEKRSLVSAFIDAYLKLTGEELKVYEELRKQLPALEQEEIMEIETGWMRKGREIGRTEGREIGKLEGKSEGREEGWSEGQQQLLQLIIQLQRKLGLLDESVLNLLNLQTRDTIRILERELANFNSPADLKKWLERSRDIPTFGGSSTNKSKKERRAVQSKPRLRVVKDD